MDDVLAKVQAGDYKKVVLEPLMIVAGDHANNDMAGDEERVLGRQHSRMQVMM